LPRLRKPAFFSAIAASVLSKSRVERASRSSRMTSSTSPALSWASARRNCGRSAAARAPLATSRNTFPAPAARSFAVAKQHRIPLAPVRPSGAS
jgi:hypothetical protein